MTEHDSRNRSGMWRAWITPMVLIVIALAQITFAKTAGLCPWKGGGFGMFSTTDTTAVRTMRVFIERPALSEELNIAEQQQVQATQAKLFPSDRLLTRLALAIVSREQSYKRPVNAVRLEVWRTEFGIGSLEAQDRLVRTFRYPVVQSAD
jgi:hypothetical protein